MRRVNFRWESALYSALGGEEKPVVLMLQIYTVPKAYYTAPSAWPQRAPSATEAPLTLTTLAAPNYRRQ